MLPEIAALLPPDVAPVLLTDRQFPGRPLLGLLQEYGWHWLLRIRRNFPIHLADGRCMRVGELAPQPGTRRMVQHASVCDIPTTVVAVWRTKERDPSMATWAAMSHW